MSMETFGPSQEVLDILVPSVLTSIDQVYHGPFWTGTILGPAQRGPNVLIVWAQPKGPVNIN